MPNLTDSTIKINFQVDTKQAVAAINEVTNSLGALKNASQNISVNTGTGAKVTAQAQNTQFTQQLQQATAALNQASQNMVNASKASQKTQSGTTGGGGNAGGGGGGGGGGNRPGGRQPPVPPQTGGGLRGSFNLLDNVKTVARFTASASLVRAGFDAFGKGVSVVADVQNQIQQLNKVLNTSKKNLDELKGAAIATAKEFGLSTTEVLKGFTIFAQQGKSPDEVKKLGRVVAAASNVSQLDTTQLSELISVATQTFGDNKADPAAQALKVLDSILAVEGKSAVSEAELGDVLKRIGVQAKTAGVDQNQLLALTTVVKEGTRAPSEEIATSLRFVLKNLSDSKTLKNIKTTLPKEIGDQLKFTTDTGDLRGAFDILQDIAKIFPKLNKQQQLNLAGKISETRFVNKFTALLNGFGKTGEIINTAESASGEVFQRNATVMQSLQKQLGKTGSAFEGFAIEFGSNFVEPAMTFLRVLEKSFNILESMSKVKLPLGLNGGGVASAIAGPLALLGAGKALGIAGNVGSRILGGGAATVASAGVAGAAGTAALTGASFSKSIAPVLKTLGGLFTGSTLKNALLPTLSRLPLIGSSAGPIGTAIGFAVSAVLTTLLTKGFTRLVETSKDKGDRLGISEKGAVARSNSELFSNAISNLNTLIEKQNNIDPEKNKLNSRELKNLQDKTMSEIADALKLNADASESLKSNGIEVLGKNGIYLNDRGKRIKVEDPKALKYILEDVKKQNEIVDMQSKLTQSILDLPDREKSLREQSPGKGLDALASAFEKNKGVLNPKDFKNLNTEERKALKDRNILVGEVFKETLDRAGSLFQSGGPKDIQRSLSPLTLLELGKFKGESLLGSFFKFSKEKLLIGDSTDRQIGNRTRQDVALKIQENLAKREKDLINTSENAKNINSSQLKDITTGSKVLFKSESGQAAVGTAAINAKGNRVFKLITDQGDIIYRSLSQVATQFNSFKTVDAGSINKTKAEQAIELSRDLTLTGFGAGKTRRFSEDQLFNAGPKGLRDFADQIAGTFNGFTSEGLPQFNLGLQQIFKEAQDSQANQIRSAKDLEAIGNKEAVVSSTTAAEIENTRNSLEGIGLLARAVENFGSVVKALDSSISKLGQFQARQESATKISPIQTGALAKFGGQAPEVLLGRDKIDLNPLERAAVALPNTFKQLSNLQFQASELQNIRTQAVADNTDLARSVQAASTGALSKLDIDKLNAVLNNAQTLGIQGPESINSIEELMQNPSPENQPSRQELISNILPILGQLNSRVIGGIDSSGIQAQIKEAEVAAKTATALTQLQISAEQTALSINQLEKFGSLFKNLDFAKGEGPAGRLGSKQPTFFTLEGNQKLSEARKLDFSNVNQFEQERQLARRLASSEVRSGRVKVLDENRQAITPISDEQLKVRLQDIGIREGNFKTSEKEGLQQQRLGALQKGATDLITGIDTILTTKELQPDQQKGLQNLQQQLLGLSKLPANQLVNSRGDINFKAFDLVKQAPGQIEKLLPQDMLSGLPREFISSLLGQGVISKESAIKGISQDPGVAAATTTAANTTTMVTYLQSIDAKTGTGGIVKGPAIDNTNMLLSPANKAAQTAMTEAPMLQGKTIFGANNFSGKATDLDGVNKAFFRNSSGQNVPVSFEGNISDKGSFNRIKSSKILDIPVTNETSNLKNTLNKVTTPLKNDINALTEAKKDTTTGEVISDSIKGALDSGSKSLGQELLKGTSQLIAGAKAIGDSLVEGTNTLVTALSSAFKDANINKSNDKNIGGQEVNTKELLERFTQDRLDAETILKETVKDLNDDVIQLKKDLENAPGTQDLTGIVTKDELLAIENSTRGVTSSLESRLAETKIQLDNLNQSNLEIRNTLNNLAAQAASSVKDSYFNKGS